MTYTDDQLKAALVRALPERLYFAPFDGFCWQTKSSIVLVVTPHEWVSIVEVAKAKLDNQSRRAYAARLESIRSTITHDSNAYVHVDTLFGEWQQEAEALADIGAITVEEKE